jgi:hypothetical protein
MAVTIQGLDVAAFGACLDANKYEQRVLESRREAEVRRINQTPTFIVNGQPFPGVQSVAEFRQIFAQVAPNVTFDQ